MQNKIINKLPNKKSKPISESFLIETVQNLKGFMLENFPTKVELDRKLENVKDEIREEMNVRFDGVEKKFGSVEGTLGGIEGRLTRIESTMATKDDVGDMAEHISNQVMADVDDVKARLSILEHRKN